MTLLPQDGGPPGYDGRDGGTTETREDQLPDESSGLSASRSQSTPSHGCMICTGDTAICATSIRSRMLLGNIISGRP